MGRAAGRTPEQTRRQLLDAAATAVQRHGLSAPLSEIAKAAGVSKGGLIYHFASKEDLLHALAANLLEEFREAVHQAIDPADRAPGRLVRAYVRASLDAPDDASTVRERITLQAMLMTDPAIEELSRADTERWERDLAEDGLAPGLITLIVAAADGACTATLWGADIRTEAYEELGERLIAMTRE
ncbi:TetR/AcrR family transcriptional regulator [Nocardioides insulae]|uniref:TetR/AcrR family transcriptional regulator n=1 Tax=Nocardioides insulae TaxID=394734 RepID=UPI00040EA9E4|nr:TetR family transcriptional regulator [Nocardioides insulae]